MPRKVSITQPDGRVRTFSSVSEAIEYYGFKPAVRNRITTGEDFEKKIVYKIKVEK